MKIFPTLRNAVKWAGFDLDRPDGATAQAVVMIDPITGAASTDNQSVMQAIPDRENLFEVAADWGNFSGVNTAGGDFVTAVSGVNGQFIIALSASPLSAGESAIVNYSAGVVQPCALEFAGSFVRTGVSFATTSLFANDPVAASGH